MKSVTALGMSQASSSLTLREEDLNESRSSTTTWRTATKTKPVDKKMTHTVHAKKRFFMANKTGQGSVSVPAQSKEAQFFSTVEPLIQGQDFQVEM